MEERDEGEREKREALIALFDYSSQIEAEKDQHTQRVRKISITEAAD